MATPRRDVSAQESAEADMQVDTFSTQPHARSDDKATSVRPKEDDEQVEAIVHQHEVPAPLDDPIITIIECMDTIHRASIDIPSSDELAQVLLCVQQLKDAIYTYTQAQAQRVVDAVDTGVNE